MRNDLVSAAVLTIGVAACAPPEQLPTGVGANASTPAVTAATFDPGPTLSADAYLREDEFAAANVERGELLSLACLACHTFAPGQDHMLGPNLGGVFGSQAASKDGFMYSEALAATGLVWTPRSLDAWLAAPSTFVPGTSMVFAGYSAADERRDLIAYLLHATQ